MTVSTFQPVLLCRRYFLNEICCLFLDHENTEHHLRIHPRPSAQYSRAAPVAHQFCVCGYCQTAFASAELVGERGNYRAGKFAIRRFFRGSTWSPESSVFNHLPPHPATCVDASSGSGGVCNFDNSARIDTLSFAAGLTRDASPGSQSSAANRSGRRGGGDFVKIHVAAPVVFPHNVNRRVNFAYLLQQFLRSARADDV